MKPFKSSYFCMAYDILCCPDKKWSSWKFSGFSRTDIVDFLKILKNMKILTNNQKRGSSSFLKVIFPEKLLKVCIKQFKGDKRKVFQFTSKKSYEEIISAIKDKDIEFYLGGFSGVRAELRDVFDNKLTVIIPKRAYFEGYALQKLQIELGIRKVPIEGDMKFIYPMYGSFVRYKHKQENGIEIPNDFYSYLSMIKSKNSLEVHQAHIIENNLRGKHGNFLSWK